MRATSTSMGVKRSRGITALAGAWRLALVALLVAISGLSQGGAAPAGAAVIGSNSRFGLVAAVGTRYGLYGDQGQPIEILAQTGAKWVKEEFRWDWVEPSRGVWTWAFMDEAVNEERKRGLDILGLLDYTAGWAVGSSNPVSNQPPPLDLWSNYVAQTVERYKDRVHAWEVWNEPNMPVFWSGTKEQYAQLLAVTYDTIERVDPTATVLGPAISGIDESWLNAVNWDKFDVLALHIYTEPAFLNDQGYSFYNQGLPNLQRVLAARGGKPLWVTEFGFSSASGPEAWQVGNEELQARYLTQQIVEMLAFPGVTVEKILPYDFNDDTPGGGFGLLRNDWSSRKPAFAAYRTAVDRLDGAVGRGRFDAGAGVFGFRFARDGQLVDVVWAPNGGMAVIPSGGDGEVYDINGGRRVVSRGGNDLRLPVNADPLYVVHQEGANAGAPGNPPAIVESRFFPETNKAVKSVFLAYWRDNGGLPLYGYPLTDEIQEQLEDGQTYTVQYFERARFEYHPENPSQYNVLLGQFGRRIRPADPPTAPIAGQRYFAETGHNLGGVFQDYWNRNGGLSQFGYPISEEITETLEDGKPYTVQYFERARFEWHPENPVPYQVLLGQFGRRILAESGR